jgi:cAMP-dependent protein kinase regulator
MRTSPPDLPGASTTTDSPIDRTLALLLANEKEAALRWGAAIVAQDESLPSALILTCRLLAELGRTEAAIEGLRLGLEKSIDTGNLPLAVAAVADLRALGVDVTRDLDEIASAFCASSKRLTESAPPPPPLRTFQEFQPLSSYLTGPALLSKATQIIHEASRRAREAKDGADAPPIPPLPLFSALEKDGLRALIEAFETITVPAGKEVIVQGEEGAEAYIVARGELEVRRKNEGTDGPESGTLPITLARLTNGALFGEMALLSRAPRAASVIACRPSILLLARREALEAVAEKRPEVGIELAAHCRRRMVANLVRTSPVLRSVPAAERPSLVERFETKAYEKGDRLITTGEDASGLHLIASGEVSVVGYEGTEPFVISTLGVGEVVGEVSLVLRRKANADVVAVRPTVTLHLPREDFMDLVREHPAILHSLYMMAVARDEETSSVLETSTVSVTDDDVLV